MTRFERVPNLAIAALVVVALAVAAASGYWFARRGQPASLPAQVALPATGGDILYWYDPMVPEQHFDKPGKSPYMDMQLVPKRASGASEGGIRIAPAVRQNLGVRTALVQSSSGAVSETVAAGSLQWDLRGERRVSSRVDGFVDNVLVSVPFERVQAGQPLATIVSPKLATAVAEARALAASGSAEARSVGAAARSRLQVLGLGAKDTQTAVGGVPRLVLRAPVSGVLSEIVVRAGDNVAPGQTLFRINATDPVWMEARVPQGSIGALPPGTLVSVGIGSFPGETFQGRVDSLVPQIDPQTRAQALRIVLDNRDGRLVAGMLAEARISQPAARSSLWVPSEALILTGTDARVIVEREGGFAPVRVVPGHSSAGRTEILHGLSGGERVVVSGQFLLDSEASLSGALQRLDDPGSSPTAPEQPKGRQP